MKSVSEKELAEDVVDLLRSYNDLVILAEPLLLNLWQSVGLTFSQIRALRWIRSNGPLSARELAELTYTPAPSLTRLLSKLEDDGMVVRSIDRTDRRRILIAITAKGRKVLGEHYHLLGGTIFAKAAQTMSPAVRAQLTKNLREFRAQIDKISDGGVDRALEPMSRHERLEVR